MVHDSEFQARVRRAQEKLMNQFLNHPDVSLIDVGYAPEGEQVRGQVVLRIHVRDRWVQARSEERVTFPTQVDDIPVIVMRGDYQLE
jgi:hypothetical protein